VHTSIDTLTGSNRESSIDQGRERQSIFQVPGLRMQQHNENHEIGKKHSNTEIFLS